MQQYQDLKKQYPQTLLFFRLGDFYELFFDDAVTGSRELEITLTARQKEHGNPIPMCGVPYHAVTSYIARLVRKGYRVAICEQTEEPSKLKKLVKREVVRVITPGTALDPQLLEASESSFLAAVSAHGETAGAAFLDLTTGEFRATEILGKNSWERIVAEVDSYAPRELLFAASLSALINGSQSTLPLDKTPPATIPVENETQARSGNQRAIQSQIALTQIDDWNWRFEDCSRELTQTFGVKTLEGFGLKGKTEAVRAAGAILRYVHDTQHATAAHVTGINFYAPEDHLILDSITVRNLDLVEPGGSSGSGGSNRGRKQTVLGIIEETMTSMGARLIRDWLLRPSIDIIEINTRLDSVEEFFRSSITRDKLRELLKNMADLERLIGRINLGTSNPRDLVALRRSLDKIPEIKSTLIHLTSSLIRSLVDSLSELNDLRSLIASAIADDPPINIVDGGVVRAGFSEELDSLRSEGTNAKGIIAALEEHERTRTGINTLKIRFNNVFGYYIEVSKAAAVRVPDDYHRRQTLTNAERYTMPELKELESRVLGAEGKIIELETAIYKQVRDRVVAETNNIQSTARALAILDSLSALAETAVRRSYVRPILHESEAIEIAGGRHPVIEAVDTSPFIPNDIFLNNTTDQILIITGPNMGGKSTVMRQTAIICILAQMGSFVPAVSARLPVLDRIMTRVGASDDLSHGRSTFMVEMVETATILHTATPRSLVLLDEIGRGTSTFDGLSIAWAVAEYLHDSSSHAAKTLFATHYHELTELAERLPGAQNYQIAATERDGGVVFLYKLQRGRDAKSYGIEVAKLAGLPQSVLARAREVLQRLERFELNVFAGENEDSLIVDPDEDARNDALRHAVIKRGRHSIAAQATLFDLANNQLINELKSIDIDTLSEREAKSLLLDLKNRIM